jgi:hypothetical protein
MAPQANATLLHHVDAPLTYLVPGERPVTYTYEPPPGVPWRTGTYADVKVPVADGRGGHFTLDQHGFALIRRASAVSDFSDERAIRDVYLRECERIMREATGASKVLAFDYNLRSGSVVGRGANGVREPVRRVHNDFTLKSGPRRAADELRAAGEDPEKWLRHRFALINLWRPVRGTVRQTPLAVCDAKSLTLRDFVETDLVYRDRVGETYTVTHNPRHRWFYFPEMHTDEALLLKCYDSDESGRARFTAHTAFDDPTTPAGAPPRESIEVRTLVMYGSGA